MLKIKQLFFLLMFVGCGLGASNKHFPRRSVSPKSNTAAKSTSFDFGFAEWQAEQISLDAQNALPESAYKINKTGDKVLDLSKPAFLRDRAGKYKTWLIGGTISTAAIIAGIILGLSLHREKRAAQAQAQAQAQAEADAKAAAEKQAEVQIKKIKGLPGQEDRARKQLECLEKIAAEKIARLIAIKTNKDDEVVENAMLVQFPDRKKRLEAQAAEEKAKAERIVANDARIANRRQEEAKKDAATQDAIKARSAQVAGNGAGQPAGKKRK